MQRQSIVQQLMDPKNKWEDIFVRITHTKTDGMNDIISCRICDSVYADERDALICCFGYKKILMQFGWEKIQLFYSLFDNITEHLFSDPKLAMNNTIVKDHVEHLKKYYSQSISKFIEEMYYEKQKLLKIKE